MEPVQWAWVLEQEGAWVTALPGPITDTRRSPVMTTPRSLITAILQARTASDREDIPGAADGDSAGAAAEAGAVDVAEDGDAVSDGEAADLFLRPCYPPPR
jgi:hypothetical protein